MKIFYKALFFLTVYLFIGFQVRATHIMGADITYTYIGLNSLGEQVYFVKLGFYRDCCNGCLVAGPNSTLTVMDSCTGTTTTYNMNPDSCLNGCEINVLCPGQQSTCDNFASIYPGVEKYEDTVTITLPTACSNWTVSWTDGSRNATISNLQNPSGQSIYIQAVINNSVNPATGTQYAYSSIYFTRYPVPFVCDNNPGVITYSNGDVDPNAGGDSVVYTLVNPLTAANTPIPHTAGYTSTQPVMSSPPVTFDPSTGIMGFDPTQQEVDVITFLVQVYQNGVLVSSTMRDVQLTILNCSIPLEPTGSDPINLINADTTTVTIGGVVRHGVVRICPSTASGFDVSFKDPSGRNVTLTSDITGTPSAIPGATFAQVGTGDSVLGQIDWTPTPGDTGCHQFEITVATNDCPIPGSSVISYTVCVLTKVTVAPHSIIYCGTPIQLTATGGSNATWSPTTGLTFPGTIYDPLAAPSVTTLYTFTSDCGSDTALIIYNPPFQMSAGPGGTICQNNDLQLNGTVDSLYAPYTYLWIPATDLANPVTNTADDTILDPIASPQQTTTYTLQVTANTGCIRTQTVTVNVNGQAPAIRAHASPDTICPGQPVQLWVNSEPQCGAATVPCTGAPDIIQVGTGISVQGGSGFVYPSPYGNYDKSARHQFLFHANELYSLIGSGGQITSVGMDIGTLNSGSTLNNFTIKMGCAPYPLDSLTGYVNESWLTTVYTGSYTPVAGWNIHTLQTAYNWDGLSDLIVDVCFNDNTNSNINNKMVYTTTAFPSVWFTASNSSPVGECGITGTVPSPIASASAYYQRPNFKFNICVPPISNAAITWAPSAPPNGVATVHKDTTSSNPINETTYNVTLSDTNGCSSSSFVTVFVDTAVQLSVNPDTFICTVSPVILHAVVTTSGVTINPAAITYTWTVDPPGASAPATGTGTAFANPTVNPTATTTYICTISGAGFCAITDSATVSIGSSIPVTKIVDSISCAGGNNGKVIIDMTSGTPPYTYTWSPAAGNVDSVVNLSAGTYELTVVDHQGCTGHDTTMLANPASLALVLDSVNILCFGNATGAVTAIVTGGRTPYRYTWSPAAGNTGNLTGLIAGTYHLTVTDTSGCTIAGTVNVAQPTQLVSSAASTNLTGAGTNDGTITLTTSGGTPGYTYSSVPAVSGLPNATNLDTGTYIITVCDANNCCVKDTAIITAPPPIFITFVTTNNLCAGQCNGSATASGSGGVLPYTYSWIDVTTGGTPAGSTTNTITNLCAGTYKVTLTDSNGLQVSKDTTITAPPALTVTIDSTTITCFNAANGSLDAIPAGGTPTYTVVWNPGSSSNNPLTGLSPGTYIAQVTDQNGCLAADTAWLGQPAPVAATILSTDSVHCFGDANGFANVAGSGGTPPYTYAWSGSSSVDSFASNLSAGAQTVTVTDSKGCIGSATFSIGAPSQVVISAIDTISAHCTTSHDGSAVAVVSGGSPAYTYAWNGNPASPVDSITGLSPGTYSLTVTDSRGCTQSQSFTINTQYILSISLTTDSVTCYGDTNGLAYVTVNNGYPPYFYSWLPSSSTSDSATDLPACTASVVVTDRYGCHAPGSAQVGQPNPIIDQAYFTDPLCTGQSNGKVWVTAGNTTAPYTYLFNGSTYTLTDTVTGLAAGTYGFTVTDGRGCTKTDAVTLTDPSQLNVAAPAVTNITCANEANGSIALTVSGATPPYTYAWNPGSYNASSEDSLGPATYDITVSDANGCSVSVSVTMVAPPPISFTYIQSDSTSCPDSADGHIVVNVVGGTPGNTIPYEYAINGGAYQENHNFYNLIAGVYSVSVMDSPGCILDTMITVGQPLPVAVAILPQDSVIQLGSSIQLFTTFSNPQGESINSYTWSPGTGLSCIDCANPFASPYQTTQYYLVVNYGKNCTTSTTNTVQVGPPAPVYIPNAFTPNGDGINDYFEAFGSTLYGVSMKIFNRWGEKVFDSGDDQWAAWDGTYKGVAQPTGVYVYYAQLVFLDGSRETREGSITLIR